MVAGDDADLGMRRRMGGRRDDQTAGRLQTPRGQDPDGGQRHRLGGFPQGEDPPPSWVVRQAGQSGGHRWGRINRFRGNGIELHQERADTGVGRGMGSGRGQDFQPCEKKHKVLYMGLTHKNSVGGMDIWRLLM